MIAVVDTGVDLTHPDLVGNRTTVRIKLRKPALRQLKRRLRLNTRVVVRNAIGLRAARSGTIMLRVRRR